MQKPVAFTKEIAHVERLGGKLVWPVATKEITTEDVVTEDGRLIPGDMVIVAVDETPVLDYLPDSVRKCNDWLQPDANGNVLPSVFAAGDAIAAGHDAAYAADLYVRGLQHQPENHCSRIPDNRLQKAYFEKGDRCQLPPAAGDYRRCISCSA